MTKTVIALSGVYDCGKTSTIRRVFELLQKEYNIHIVVDTNLTDQGDFSIVIEINGKRLGIESQGDPNSRIYKSIPSFVELQCDIIICATRSRGETVTLVEGLEKQGYQVKWFTKEKLSSKNEQELKAANFEVAQRIISMVNDLLAVSENNNA